MKKPYLLLLAFLLAMLYAGSSIAQSISYRSSFDLSNGATFSSSADVGSESTPNGFIIVNNGTKLFTIGSGEVNQYTLTTPDDLDGGLSYDGFSFFTGSNAWDIDFSNDGMKMFLIDATALVITQYALGSPFDISTAPIAGPSLDVSTEDTQAIGIEFNDNGTKLYVVGTAGDDVNQYTLTMPFDLTSVFFDGTPLDVQEVTSGPRDLFFSNDGSRLFIFGEDQAFEWELTSPYDVTSGGSYTGNSFDFSNEETNARGIQFNSSGTKILTTGSTSTDIIQYLLNLPSLSESLGNTGSFTESVTILLEGETFTHTGSSLENGMDYSITNLPSGLTPDLAISADGSEATLSLSGSATANQSGDNIAGLIFDFENSAFLMGDATAVANAVATNSGIGINFRDNAPFISYGSLPDVQNSTFSGNSIPVMDTNPRGFAFNNNGTKVFVTGTSSSAVHEYDLTTAYDITTASYSGNSHNVAFQETSPEDVLFNSDGSKMYVIGSSSDQVQQYSLTSPFDLSVGVSHQGSSVTFVSPVGMEFDPTGTKLFITDISTDMVSQYALATPFIVTSGMEFMASYDISANDPAAQGIKFSDDGLSLFLIGNSGEINTYSLTYPFEIGSGISFHETYIVGVAVEANPRDLLFSPDRTKMFVLGTSGDDMNQLVLNTPQLQEPFDNDGSVVGPQVIRIDDDEFNNPGGTLSNGGDYSVSGLPAGLTPTMSVAADGKSATFTLDGNAPDNQFANSINNLQFTFENSAFVGNNASNVLNSTGDSQFQVIFRDNHPRIVQEEGFDLSGTIVYTGSPFSVAAQDGSPVSVRFSPDGMRMFILGNSSDNIYQYGLANPFDVSGGVSFTGSFTGLGLTSPQGMTFSTDGSKLYVVDNSADIVNQYSLLTPFVVTSDVTADGSFDVSSEESSPTGVAFTPDGMRMFVTGSSGDDINQYTLSTPFDINGPILYDGDPFSVSSQDAFPADLVFNPKGTKMYVLGAGSDAIYVYTLANRYDITTGVTYDNTFLGVGTEETSPAGLAFGSSGTSLFIIGGTGDDVNRYSIETSGLDEASANDGSIDGSLVFNIVDDSFANVGSTLTIVDDFSISSFPNGLTPIMSVSPDGKNATLTFSGNAMDHQEINSVSSNTLSFLDGAFQGGTSANVLNSQSIELGGIEFQDNQFLSYSNGFNLLESGAEIGTSSIAATASSPAGMSFNDDGSMLYVISLTNDEVDQYTLSTPYVVTSGVSNAGAISLGSTTNPSGITFNKDGSKMFISANVGSGSTVGRVNQYDLSVPFNVTSAVFDVFYTVNTQVNRPNSLAFNKDGTKMYVLGILSDEVHQYNLANAFDLNAGVTYDNVSFSLASETTSTEDIIWGPDGGIMYMVGGSNVYQYQLNSVDDLAAGATLQGTFELQSTGGKGIAFSADGTTLVEVAQDAILHQYELTENGFSESANNLGAVDGFLRIRLTNDVFTSAGGSFTPGSQYTVSGVPAGLTPNLTISQTGTSATLTLSGMADDHQDSDDEPDLVFTFDDAAFSVSSAADVINASSTPSGTGIDFDDNNPSIAYGNRFDFSVDLPVASGITFDISSQDTDPLGLTFNPGGTKMYMLGVANDEIYQYSLSSAFDITTATFDGSPFDISATGGTSSDVIFNNTGSKMYVLGGYRRHLSVLGHLCI